MKKVCRKIFQGKSLKKIFFFIKIFPQNSNFSSLHLCSLSSSPQKVHNQSYHHPNPISHHIIAINASNAEARCSFMFTLTPRQIFWFKFNQAQTDVALSIAEARREESTKAGTISVWRFCRSRVELMKFVTRCEHRRLKVCL